MTVCCVSCGDDACVDCQTTLQTKGASYARWWRRSHDPSADPHSQRHSHFSRSARTQACDFEAESSRWVYAAAWMSCVCVWVSLTVRVGARWRKTWTRNAQLMCAEKQGPGRQLLHG